MKNHVKTKTISELFELLYAAMDYERSKKSYGTDVIISSSEIYILKCIEQLDIANVTTLAEELDVSKSAVSQAVKKLNTKGLVNIEIDKDNQSRYVLSLTDKGMVAHREHMRSREELVEGLGHLLDSYDGKTCQDISRFLTDCRKKIKDFV